MRTLGLFLSIFLSIALLSTPTRAVTLIRDADIEYGLRELAKPILQAAGLSPSQVRILVVQDSTMNAFVADTQHIFLNSGLILTLKTPEALQAVIAHEVAHISNGHIARRLANMRSARTAAGLGMALAAAAAAAGADGRAAAGIGIGAQSSALRLFLSHTRAEESSADLSSVRYLVRAGIDPRGAVEVQELFRGQEALSTARQDPYMRTHPVTRDRLRALEGVVASIGKDIPPNNAFIYWHARVQGKLSAFTRAPSWTLRRAKDSPSQDIRLMREAVAHHHNSNLAQALKSIDAAIALRPKDPFLLDLKGQILLENRRAEAAVATYGQAARMAGNDALIRGSYGRALLASGQVTEALRALEAARARDFSDPRILRDLAVAYAKAGQPALASVVTAERFAVQGRLKDAEIHAKRAVGALPQGSGPWNRAQDVLSAAQQAGRR